MSYIWINRTKGIKSYKYIYLFLLKCWLWKVISLVYVWCLILEMNWTIQDLLITSAMSKIINEQDKLHVYPVQKKKGLKERAKYTVFSGL